MARRRFVIHNMWTTLWIVPVFACVRPPACQPLTVRTCVTEPAPGGPTPEDATSPPDLDLELVWREALDGLDDSLLSPQHRAWVNLTRPLGLVAGNAVLEAPNDFVKEIGRASCRERV